jgi:hypothetical protein
MTQFCSGVEVVYAGTGAVQFTQVHVNGTLKYRGQDIQDGITWAKGYCACQSKYPGHLPLGGFSSRCRRRRAR